ncbi:hypothetical protein [Rhodococcoides fascians]|uniref:hypothetical protein n=1 Tax=Rhodococcoides fascians TaxID=1828 RepID=UPI00055BA8F7|nr:hypothetical protein [Rhodococcus fascians]
MPFNTLSLNVMLSGPGDVTPHLTLIESVLHEWTRERAKMSGITLIPRHWSTSTVSSFSLGQGGQAEINQQLVDEADIVFAVFHTKLGTATSSSVSGTAEEIDKAIEAGHRVHVLFSRAPIPHDHDPKQFAALAAFKKALGDRGLYREFSTDDELRGLVRSSLEDDVPHFEPPVPDLVSSSDKTSARLDGRYDYREVAETDSKGRVRTKKKGQRIAVRNSGEGVASDVVVDVEPVGRGSLPIMLNNRGGEPATFETIAPNTEVSIPIALTMGSAQELKISFSWTEDGVTKTFSHIISLY